MGNLKAKINVEQYPTYIQNYKWMFELIDEIMMEAFWAPFHDELSIRSPYYKDLAKRKLGRTKEERDLKLKQKEELWKKAIHDILIEKSIVKDIPYEDDLIKRRKDLGYKEPLKPVEIQTEVATFNHD